MPTAPQYTVRDWLDLHALTAEQVIYYCHLIEQSFRIDTLDKPRARLKGLSFDIRQSLEYLILPAFRNLLGTVALQKINLAALKIVNHKPGNIDLPFTEWDAKSNEPTVHLVWSGTADDLICLAHEIAHAAHMILSKGVFIPPIAREVCAFLGELAIIQHAKKTSSAVYHELQCVWHHENQRYLGADSTRLRNDFEVGSVPYHYRLNYPLARVTAMSLFATHGRNAVREVFTGGERAVGASMIRDAIQGLPAYGSASSQGVRQSNTQDDISAFQMSLSPLALQAVRMGEIDYAWLYRPAKAVCVVGDRVECISNLPEGLWVKWRSLGVFAVAALNRGQAEIPPNTFLKGREESAVQSPEIGFSRTTPWIRPLKFDALTALGMTIQQLATSLYHRRFQLSHYLPVEILPPLLAEQCLVLLDKAGTPHGVVTWAWLEEAVKDDLHITGRALRNSEWSGGPSLFFNDWITDPDILRGVVKYMKQEVFPNKTASSLRRCSNGAVRRVNKWTSRKQNSAFV